MCSFILAVSGPGCGMWDLLLQHADPGCGMQAQQLWLAGLGVLWHVGS